MIAGLSPLIWMTGGVSDADDVGDGVTSRSCAGLICSSDHCLELRGRDARAADAELCVLSTFELRWAKLPTADVIDCANPATVEASDVSS